MNLQRRTVNPGRQLLTTTDLDMVEVWFVRERLVGAALTGAV